MASSFERLVTRAMRAPTDPGTSCPAAETLAAYLDGSLRRDERASVELHASKCTRCAAHLAALVQLEDQLSAGAPARPRWRRPWLVPVAAAIMAGVVWLSLPREHVAELTRPATVQAPAPAPAPPPAAVQDKPAAPALSDASPRRAPQESRSHKAKTLDAAEAVPEPRADQRRTVPQAPRDQAAPAPVAAPDRMESFGNAGAVAQQKQAFRESMLLGSRSDLVVSSTDPKVAWRVTGGHIERTTDDGALWVIERGHGLTPLVAGSAPSRDVCWMAGDGNILVRRDADGHWTRVNVPDFIIAAIEARSALDATVTGTDGRRSVTTDGGKTWTAIR